MFLTRTSESTDDPSENFTTINHAAIRDTRDSRHRGA